MCAPVVFVSFSPASVLVISGLPCYYTFPPISLPLSLSSPVQKKKEISLDGKLPNNHLTPSPKRHFTQLVAVGPFAVLGLALMASVARVCRITGITAVYEEMASEDVKEVLSSVDEGLLAEAYGDLMDDEEEGWDEGEIVEREEDDYEDDDDEE